MKKILLLASFVIFSSAACWSKENQKESLKNWKTLKNKFGWSVQYPSDWEAHLLDPDDGSPSNFDWPFISGPRSEFQDGNGVWWAKINMGCAVINCTATDLDKRSPKQVVEMHNSDAFQVLSQGEITLSGLPGYEIYYIDKLAADLFIGKIMYRVAIRYKKKNYFFSYTEIGKEAAQKIKSPQDWKYFDIAKKILQTWKFD